MAKSKTTPKKIPITSKKSKQIMTLIFTIIVGIYAYSAYFTELSIYEIVTGMPYAIDFFKNDLFPPNWSYWDKVIGKLVETWNIALISTTLAVIFCLPFAFLAASNINTNKYLYTGVRFFLNILRTIPELILAVVLVGIVGLGPISGIGALFIFSLGILAKLISETVESVDPGPLEAIRATGGNVFQVIWFGVMPQILPHYSSYSLYVLEINVRASVVLGLVGAGGIGHILKKNLDFNEFGNVSMIILMTFAAVVIIDTISASIRERLL
ncbi:phosphonate ABC transporter, permease protein PhnE [Lottiidibacillus patelloidae]|uniref:Phosphonate ABC transporter, permease protein PhnE n=1 Tax=Lottiidibacillus patelloidae TaxID=2670334 RepID=A0A263BWZ7_9BACI|nr:phosphonate ABC transporter, permease protein PhnE [Lottiidibacillus patelloidae]OZM58190.1 phosphonate ABC transporter, permease protein PhnE [Lottiidibacillus patelloidae]